MEARQRILSRLVANDGQLRRAGLALVIDHVLDQKVATWLDVDAVTALIVASLRSGNSARTIERHILPGFARARAALRDANANVAELVPADGRATIERLVSHPHGPRLLWLSGALDRDKLRALLAPVFQEVFLSFVARLPIGGGRDGAAGSAVGAAAGLVGRLGRGAGDRLLNLGKSVADGLGVDLEAKLRDAARDYSQGAVAIFQSAVAKRLATPDAQKLLEALALGVVEHVLATPVTTILEDLDRLPLTDAIGVAAPILEHNLASELWQRFVAGETHAALTLEGERTLRELLVEAGLLEHVRELILQRGDAVLRELFGSDAFGSWLDQLLAD